MPLKAIHASSDRGTIGRDSSIERAKISRQAPAAAELLEVMIILDSFDVLFGRMAGRPTADQDCHSMKSQITRLPRVPVPGPLR